MLYYTDYGEYGESGLDFSRMDEILYNWRIFVASNSNVIGIVGEVDYDTGTICQLKDVLNEGIDNAFDIIPRLRDLYQEKIYEEYTRRIEQFLGQYKLTRADISEEESSFFAIFENEMTPRVIVNIWDLWRRKNRHSGDCALKKS